MRTKSSVKLKPCWWDALVVAAVLLLAGGVFFLFYLSNGSGSDHLTAVITHKGEEVERVDLTALTADKTVTIDGAYSLTVLLSTDGAQVISAQGPTQDCVHTGKISRAGQSIVCLPEQVVIQLVGAKSDIDVVIG